jgi:hypothetical protein
MLLSSPPYVPKEAQSKPNHIFVKKKKGDYMGKCLKQAVHLNTVCILRNASPCCVTHTVRATFDCRVETRLQRTAKNQN